jgi:hypothetical protein
VLAAPSAASVEEARVVETLVWSVVGIADEETSATGIELVEATTEDEATIAEEVAATETAAEELEDSDKDPDPPTVKSTHDS